MALRPKNTRSVNHDFRSFSVFLSLVSISCAVFFSSNLGHASPLKAYQTVDTNMTKRGISSAFVRRLYQRISDPKILDQREKVVRPVLMGFTLRPDYSGHVSPQAEKACQKLKLKYSKAFRQAYRKYGVDAETIAALLWVETRHGKSIGNFEVAASYFHIASATDPALIEKILSDYKSKEFKGSKEEWKEIVQKVNERAQLRSQWALDQLEALYEMETKKHISVMKIKGSYAGAFGIPQFLPSSYLQFAQSFQKNERVPNLFSMNDAIMSVAHYLHQHGWKRNDLEKQKEALFGYNRSRDYGETILSLASNVRERSSIARHRALATEAPKP